MTHISHDPRRRDIDAIKARERELRRGLKVRRGTIRYVAGVPRKVPPGWFVVHNQVRPVRTVGMNGFRCWLQSNDEDPPLKVCGCDWASDRGYTHYRVDFDRVEPRP